MDNYDRTTMFGRLQEACVEASLGDDSAVDKKATLIALCHQKFGERATTSALEMIDKTIKH